MISEYLGNYLVSDGIDFYLSRFTTDRLNRQDDLNA